jgi:CBS domain containing-hemolysin-like protein
MLLRFLSVLGLIAINAFFVTAEFSIVSVRRSRISQLVADGDIPAQTVQSLQRSIDKLLSTTQLGITLSSLALGWIGEKTIALSLQKFIESVSFPAPISTAIAHSISIPFAFFLLAYLQIVLGELCPKTVALLYSEQLARFFAPPSLAIAKVFNPFIWILNQSTRWLLILFGIQYTGRGWFNQVTPEELQLIITTERESTGLEAEERELLKNVFEFGDVISSEAMIPRTSIVALSEDSPFKELLDAVVETGHSRYPIKGESLDDIRGIIYFKDLAIPLAKGEIESQTPIKQWIRPVRFVPETTNLSELLPMMQQSQLKMVVLVDEFGGTSGLITLQNLVDEILGEEKESFKEEDQPLRIIDDQTFLISAQMDIEEINEQLNINLPITDDYQTLAGFISYQFQKIPITGETFNFDNWVFTIVAAEGPRILQIQLKRQETETIEELGNEK